MGGVAITATGFQVRAAARGLHLRVVEMHPMGKRKDGEGNKDTALYIQLEKKFKWMSRRIMELSPIKSHDLLPSSHLDRW